ncbi:hypothetical protein F0562_032891 [Nyssa sinensis]|uniref:AP2/ERF domain-containing protein n=1 Tax=Nyssa sinensis TaxID=561372 RepID=A0A5J5ATE4_9ASTE|nr:hypothetical protein F0562_032891 [Nyssa sinensis]
MEEKEEKSELNSTRLTLVDCSVTCVPVYNGQLHADQRSTRSLENDTSFVHFSTKESNKKFGQQTNNYHGVQRLVGEYKHLEDKILSTSAIKLNGKHGLQKSTNRGVTRHKWTGKFEAHLWDGSCSTEGCTRKGKQVYLGGYETAEKAAQAHDLTALKYWGPSASAKLNFHISNYEKEIEEMESMSREELVTFLRRQSLSFTRGTSIYRGVTRNREGHWQARIKVASSKKDIYLGTFSSEEEAAKAYDIAAIHLKGFNALTNFDHSNYLQGDLKELESFPKPKRARRIGKFSSLISDSETDPHSDENMPKSDFPLDEVNRRKISALLPDHPTALMPG